MKTLCLLLCLAYGLCAHDAVWWTADVRATLTRAGDYFTCEVAHETGYAVAATLATENHCASYVSTARQPILELSLQDDVFTKLRRDVAAWFLDRGEVIRHGRLSRCRSYNEEIRALRGKRSDIYPVTMEYKAGHGHGGLPDRDKLATVLTHLRDCTPTEVFWEQTDGVIRDFFWLEDDEPGGRHEIFARLVDDEIRIETKTSGRFALCMDERLLHFGKPLKIVLDGIETTVTPMPSLSTLCAAVQRRGDPRLAYTWRHELEPVDHHGRREK